MYFLLNIDLLSSIFARSHIVERYRQMEIQRCLNENWIALFEQLVDNWMPFICGTFVLIFSLSFSDFDWSARDTFRNESPHLITSLFSFCAHLLFYSLVQDLGCRPLQSHLRLRINCILRMELITFITFILLLLSYCCFASIISAEKDDCTGSDAILEKLLDSYDKEKIPPTRGKYEFLFYRISSWAIASWIAFISLSFHG